MMPPKSAFKTPPRRRTFSWWLAVCAATYSTITSTMALGGFERSFENLLSAAGTRLAVANRTQPSINDVFIWVFLIAFLRRDKQSPFLCFSTYFHVKYGYGHALVLSSFLMRVNRNLLFAE